MKMRGFEVVTSKRAAEVKLPKRSTKNSAGYDFFAYEDIVIEPVFYKALSGFIKALISNKEIEEDFGTIKPVMVWTGIKSYMQDDEYLALYNRSSNPKKLGLILANSVGVVDSDYYNNPDNEGEIGFAFYNIFPWKVTIKKGEKIGQGVFHKFLKADGDTQDRDREGGFGSTGK